METKERSKLGAKSRKEGKAFEPRVYRDMSEKGWIVNRWSNDVEFDLDVLDIKENVAMKLGKVVLAKTKWRHTPRGMMPMNLNPGFPDFVCFKEEKGLSGALGLYDVIGVECKISGSLDKLEKEKCKWYLDNNVFSKILIASKVKEKNRIKVVYEDFLEKYG